MQHPKESKGYSIPSRAFSGTVHAHEGYFCLFSHQTEACTFHPSWRRAVSLSLSHLRDRQHGMIWQDRVDALTQPGEELVEASFAVSQQDSISSLLPVPENPAGVGLKPWGCSSAERGQLSLTEGILTLPSWTSIHSEGAVSPGPPLLFPMWYPHGEAGTGAQGNCATCSLSMAMAIQTKQAPNAIITLVLQFCVPWFTLTSTERQHKKSLQALLTGSGSKNNFILTWNHKKCTYKATKHILQF